MDSSEKLELKIDALTDTTRSVLDALRSVLSEFQKQAQRDDTLVYRINELEKKVERASDSRKEMYERIEKIEQRCVRREAIIPSAPPCKHDDDGGIDDLYERIGKYVVGVIAGVITAWITFKASSRF